MKIADLEQRANIVGMLDESLPVLHGEGLGSTTDVQLRLASNSLELYRQQPEVRQHAGGYIVVRGLAKTGACDGTCSGSPAAGLW
jgi:hypothetical protein